MMAYFSGNAITTKAKAMYGKRLETAQYRELAGKKNLTEIAVYLRDETAYGTALQGVSTSVKRGELEEVLRSDKFEKYERLMQYAQGRQKRFYHYIVDKAEIEQILQMIRLLGIGKPEQYITQYPAFLEKKTDISLMALAKVRSYDELISSLHGTEYEEVLIHCRPADGVMDYTKCEIALYTHFYEQLHDTINHSFRGKTRRELLEIFSVQVEMMNMMHIYRMKRFYPQMTADEIKAYILPPWRNIPKATMESFLSAANAEVFASLLSSVKIDGENLMDMGGARELLHKKYLRFASGAPVAFTAYMTLCEIEIDSIISIIEAVDYKISNEEIMTMIIKAHSTKKGGA